MDSQSPVPSEIPANPPTHSNWPLVVSGLAIVLALGAGGLLLVKRFTVPNIQRPTFTTAPTPEVTPAWHTITNTQYSFSYDIPTNLEVSGNDNSSDITTQANNRISVLVRTDSSPTIAEYLIKADKISQTAYEGQSSMEVHSTKKTVINDYSIIQREEYLLAADLTQITTYFKKGSIVVSFSLQPTPGNPLSQDEGLYAQILSTFKFIAPVDLKAWKTYEFKEGNIQFQVPAYFGNLAEETVTGGDSGTEVCFSKAVAKSWFVESVHAGGGCNSDFYAPLRIGTTSVDYVSGRDGSFNDLQGFVFQNGEYQVKFVSERLLPVPQELVTKVTNRNGVEVLKVIGKSDPEQGPSLFNSLGDDHVGLILNTKNQQYTGFTIAVLLDDKTTMATVDQIIASIKYTN